MSTGVRNGGPGSPRVRENRYLARSLRRYLALCMQSPVPPPARFTFGQPKASVYPYFTVRARERVRFYRLLLLLAVALLLNVAGCYRVDKNFH